MSRRSRSSGDKNLVGFMVAGVNYAFDIFRVREVINPQPTTALPHSPPAVVGVADHRGDVVPVIDMRLRFGLEPVEPGRRVKWIVVDFDGRLVVLVVDSVTQVFGVSEAQRRGVPSIGIGDSARGIVAVYSTPEGLAFVLDIDRVAAVAQLLELPQQGRSTTSGRA